MFLSRTLQSPATDVDADVGLVDVLAQVLMPTASAMSKQANGPLANHLKRNLFLKATYPHSIPLY